MLAAFVFQQSPISLARVSFAIAHTKTTPVAGHPYKDHCQSKIILRTGTIYFPFNGRLPKYDYDKQRHPGDTKTTL